MKARRIIAGTTLLAVCLALGLALAAWLPNQVLANPPWGGNVKVNDDAAALVDQYNPPAVAADSSGNVYAVWVDNRNGDDDIIFANSTNGGASWQASKRLNSTTADGRYQHSPDIAVDINGVIHVVWVDYPFGDSDIFYTRSSNGGATWTPEVKVNKGSGVTQNKPAIAVDNSTPASVVVHVVWEDYRDSANYASIYHASSVDGVAWVGDHRVNTISPNGNVSHADPAIAVGRSQQGPGWVHVAYTGGAYGSRMIYYAYSVNLGVNWNYNLYINVDATGDKSEPTIAVSPWVTRTTVHIAWTDKRASSSYSNIYYRNAPNGQQWFSAEQRVPDSSLTDEYNPSLGVGSDGRVHLAWRKWTVPRLGTSRDMINHDQSFNDGTSWEKDTVASHSPAEATFPDLAVGGVRAQIIWVDSRAINTNRDIYGNYSKDGLTWQNPDILVSDDGNAHQKAPAIATGGSVHALYADYRNGIYKPVIYHAGSANGAAWGDYAPVSVITETNTTDPSPDLAIDANGDLHAVWLGVNHTYGYGPAVVYASSVTSGTSWSLPVRVDDGTTFGPVSYSAPSIVTRKIVGIQRTTLMRYVAWADTHDFLHQYSGFNVYFSRSAGGVSWTSNITVNHVLSGTQTNPDLAIDSLGRLHAVWESDHAGGQYDVYYANSSDGGDTWSQEVRVNTSPTGLQNHPSIAVGPSNELFVAWHDTRNDRHEIRLNRSLDRGATWAPADVSVVDAGMTGLRDWPSVTVEPNGVVHVSWEDARVAIATIYHSQSIDQGANWSANEKVSDSLTGQGLRASMASDAGGVYTAWQDDRNGNWDIYFAKKGATAPTPTATSTNTATPTPTGTWTSPTPSSTSVPPSATPTATSTNTPVPAPTSTSTNTPTPTQGPLPAYLYLSVDDAPTSAIVNKVVGDSSGGAGLTRVDAVAKVVSLSFADTQDLDLFLTVPGDLFGTPEGVYIRDWNGGSLTSIPFTSVGLGKYRARFDLTALQKASADSLILPGPTIIAYPGPFYAYLSKQIIFRFRIPSSTNPQNVALQGELQVPGRTVKQPDGFATVKIVDHADALIVLNRSLLYEKYNTADVTSLLHTIYTTAQGWPYSHSPLGVVYDVGLYDSTLRSWNNAAVDYTSEATANVMANTLDGLIEDFYGDATEFFKFYLPFIGWLDIPIAVPRYLLVVGDDDTMPFYRYNDPYNDEQTWTTTSAANPAIRATDNDYILTDNPYADVSGNDWRNGDVELWAGRILGASASDMLNLVHNGLNVPAGTGRAVMASVDGWELGYQADDGRAGEIADLYNVPSLLVSKGWQVRNDTEAPRTIDVMTPYPADWETGFRNAANGGMDIFFIGGHNGYGSATIPGDDFTPDDTCPQAGCAFRRFGTDHPLALIVGCHGGLPVPNVGVAGGVNNDMVYDLVHEGARAYVGATGFSYGSPGDLHAATWGERLLQLYFRKLTLPGGGNSMAVGKALADAKRDYVFGAGGNNNLDKKTVTEYQLYGLPWTYLLYPGGAASTEALAERASSLLEPAPPSFTVQAQAPVRIASRTFSQTYEVKDITYTLKSFNLDGIDYDLFTIPGGLMDVSPGYPVLPYIRGFTFTLPYSASLTGLTVQEISTQPIGTYTLPVALVGPWSLTGFTYTTTTSVNYTYPITQVDYQKVGDSLLFTLMPVQYNPVNKQATFASRFKVRITYEAPVELAVSGFGSDKEEYVPGQSISTTARIVNVGDAQATVTSTLVVVNPLAETYGLREGASVNLPAGQSTDLALVWTGEPLSEGPYLARLILWQNGSPVAGATSAFRVMAGAIASVDVPEVAIPGKPATFTVGFHNSLSYAVPTTMTIAIMDNEARLIDILPSVFINVGGDATGFADFVWHPDQMPGGNYLVRATVQAAALQFYGPSMAMFRVGYMVYLPAALRGNGGGW